MCTYISSCIPYHHVQERCPVKINTGELIKTLRQNTLEGDGTMSVGGPASERGAALATMVANNFGPISRAIPPLLNVVSLAHRIIGNLPMTAIATTAWGVSNNYLPLWNQYMPRGAGPLNAPPTVDAEAEGASSLTKRAKRVVYLPSCVTRMMGPARGDDDAGTDAVHDKFFSLLEKAGYEVIVPPGIESMCCGMIMDSRGFRGVGGEQSSSLQAAQLEPQPEP